MTSMGKERENAVSDNTTDKGRLVYSLSVADTQQRTTTSFDVAHAFVLKPRTFLLVERTATRRRRAIW